MADHQAVNHDDHFEIVEALYQEATLTLSDDERGAFEQSETSQDAANEAAAQAPIKQRTVIRSRKPAITNTAVPIFTRISDLYEEAEATRILAPEEPEKEALQETAQDDQPDDDFIIPETFDTLSEDSALETETTTEPTGLSDDDIALLGDSLLQDETPPSDDVTISTQIEPAIALDDVLDGLLPPEEASDRTSPEAEALAQLDASRPQADDELAQQLADVRSAVEHAQITPQMPEAEDQIVTQDTAIEETGAEEVLASVTTGPALATFIGETVREVLDEELPHLVRGLVDEALGERQGRYGRSETPHIGLRTKPSRH